MKVNQLTLSELAGVGINTLVAIERGTGNPKLGTLGSYNIVVFLTICISYANNCFTL